MPTPRLPIEEPVVDPSRRVSRAWAPLLEFWHRSLRMSGIGYTPGAGGTASQATSKSTGVTLHAATGQITMHSAALAADTAVSFTLTNKTIAATDLMVLNHVSGGTAGAYTLNAQAGAGVATITVRNVTAGSLGEAIVLGFAVVKGQTS